MIDQSFQQYVESLHPSFERLMNMAPVSIAKLPKGLPSKGIYLFSEGDNHLYVGRTQNLRTRLGQHSNPSAPDNQAGFAFKLAREATGFTEATYTSKGSRRDLLTDPLFADAFAKAKARIREMDLRFVGDTDALRQALLEIYVAVALGTKYNDFETH
jgi:hypothetical protein